MVIDNVINRGRGGDGGLGNDDALMTGGVGVEKSQKSDDVIYVWPLTL